MLFLRSGFRVFLPAMVMAIGLVCSSCSDEIPDANYSGPVRGVSLAGAEFASDVDGFSNLNHGGLGSSYIYNSKRTIDWFAGQGVSLFRIPFRWERLQPKLGGPLDSAELLALRENVQWIHEAGGRAILDCHNYGRYFLQEGELIIEATIGHAYGGRVLVSQEDFADLWVKIGQAFSQAEASPWAYGLMNEPHNIRRSSWQSATQHVVNRMREEGHSTLLLIPGLDWSSSERWVRANGAKSWIHDPLGQIAYEAHAYFDADGSGQYRWSWEEELARDPQLRDRGAQRLKPFLAWCGKNKVNAFIGEFGVPNTNPGWRVVLDRALQQMDASYVQGCYWAAGEWWGPYPLSIQPNRAFTHAPAQLGWLMGRD